MYHVWIFPILSGYYLLSRSIFFKFNTQRFSNQKLLFHSLLAGFFILAITLLKKVNRSEMAQTRTRTGNEAIRAFPY